MTTGSTSAGPMFRGAIPALITPFRDGAVDEKAFQDLVDWQIKSGVHAIVPCGTTGESATLSHAEHERVITLAVEVASGRVPVIAGTGSNATHEAISLTRSAKSSGADAALIVTPYYNKPTQEGMYAHFKAIHDAVDLPVIIYNIPPRSVIDMSVETMARLAKLPNIVGVKDATNDLSRVGLQRHAIGPHFCQMSGEDGTAAAHLGEGGHGCISVTCNVAPKQVADMQSAWIKGDMATFAEMRDRLVPLHKALFVEASPGPVKYAVSRLGICSEELRLPMVPPQAETRAMVDEAMRFAGLLN